MSRATPEQFDHECKTEKKGYVPLKHRIESLLAAGKRLDMLRTGNGNYQVPGNSTDEPGLDPLRAPNVDLVDIHRHKKSLLSGVKERMAKAAAEKAAAKVAAEAESKAASTGPK